MGSVRSRLSYANVLSTLTFFLLLAGGVATALPGKNTVNSGDIKDNTLKSKDLKDGKAVGSADVKDGSLTGADVLDGSLAGVDIGNGSLTGAQIEDGSLAGVDIGNSSLTGAKIANGSLTDADLDLSRFLPSAFTDTFNAIGLTGTASEIMSVPITIEVPSNVFASAMIEIDSDGGADDRVFCRLSRDTYAAFISREPQADLPDATFDRSWFGLTGATAVGPGTYQIKLFCGEASGNVSSVVGNLVVWAMPS